MREVRSRLDRKRDLVRTGRSPDEPHHGCIRLRLKADLLQSVRTQEPNEVSRGGTLGESPEIPSLVKDFGDLPSRKRAQLLLVELSKDVALCDLQPCGHQSKVYRIALGIYT